MYSGMWKNDKYNGQGVWFMGWGLSRIGEWKEGRPDGREILTSPNGLLFSVESKDGRLIKMLKSNLLH
jgi:hypothetical protein